MIRLASRWLIPREQGGNRDVLFLICRSIMLIDPSLPEYCFFRHRFAKFFQRAFVFDFSQKPKGQTVLLSSVNMEHAVDMQ